MEKKSGPLLTIMRCLKHMKRSLHEIFYQFPSFFFISLFVFYDFNTPTNEHRKTPNLGGNRCFCENHHKSTK